jgi:CRISPR type IV-associated DEAD/DEAH-box helicase Csf4
LAHPAVQHHWDHLRLKADSERAAAALNKAYALLQALPDDMRLPLKPDHPWPPAVQATWSAAGESIEALAKLLESMAGRKSSNDAGAALASRLTYMKGCARALRAMLGGASGLLQFSPTKRYPSITIGPNDVRAAMMMRWGITPAVALFSGTLLYRGSTGAQLGPLIQELALPPDRTVMTAPLQPSWLLSTPRLMLPHLSEFERLVPPRAGSNGAGEDDLRHWLRHVAQEIVAAMDSAAGGMLVLMTGYARGALLAQEILRLNPDAAARLILQTAQGGLGTARQAFLQASNGSAVAKPPVWIATGPAAWASLDLSDGQSPADQDFLLTDLVIPALPFGANKSTTHVQRMAMAGFVAEISEAQRLFRQGIGRLVRREGLLRRRIWVLDGRLHHPARKAMMADFWRVLNAYPNTATIKPGDAVSR